jgi:mono/diheme cytochrome c family protein
MRRTWRPLVLGLAIAAATFFLGRAQVFEPSVATGEGMTGNPKKGEIVFERECAGCHGVGGQGGDVGPRLEGTDLDAAAVTSAVQQGRGVMPAGLVTGTDRDDVVAYVVKISQH